MSTQLSALRGLGCPKCGGIVPIPEGQVVIGCPYCGQSSVVSGDRGVLRYQVPLRTGREQAEEALHRFLGSNVQIASGLKNNAVVSDVFLVYLPFWSAWGRGVAWTFGQVRVGSGDNKRYEPREKRAASELHWNSAACDVGEFGVQRISLEGRPLEPFDSEALHRVGMVFEPVGSYDEALKTAEQAFHDTVAEQTRTERTGQLFARILSPRLGVVYYPIWVVRYLHKQRSFQVVVDGFDGSVLYGKAPGNLASRAAALVGGMAAGAFLAVDAAAGILYLTAGSDDDAGFLALAALVGGAALMAWGYRRFRFGEHYEYVRYKAQKQGSSELLLGGGELKDLAGSFSQIRKLLE